MSLQVAGTNLIIVVVELLVIGKHLCDSFYHFLKFKDRCVFLRISEHGPLFTSDHQKDVLKQRK